MCDARCPLPSFVKSVLKAPQKPGFCSRDVHFNERCYLGSVTAFMFIDGQRREKTSLNFIIETLLQRPRVVTVSVAKMFGQKRSAVHIGGFQQLQKSLEIRLQIEGRILPLRRSVQRMRIDRKF